MEGAVLRVDGVVLDLAVERCGADVDPLAHEVVVAPLLLPQDFRALQHRLAVRVKEGIGRLLVCRVRDVGVDLLPCVPQFAVFCPADDTAILERLVLRAGGDPRQQRVIVEQRADVDDVGVGVAALADRFCEPVLHLLPLIRRVDVLVVLQIVADDKVGTPLLVTSATDLLARADCLDLDAVGQQDDGGLPDLALQLAEVFLQGGVLLQLRLDVGEEALGLFRAVGEDDDVVLVAVDGGV